MRDKVFKVIYKDGNEAKSLWDRIALVEAKTADEAIKKRAAELNRLAHLGDFTAKEMGRI